MNGLVYSASLVAAFLGGILALFAPCCIVTLLPNFVGASLRRGLVALPMTALLFASGLGVVLLPIVLGVGQLGQLVGRYHGPLFVVVGLLLIALGAFILSGRHWSLPIPMPQLRSQAGNAAGSTFLLGVASGVMSSCCAPVLAGVIAMSALSARAVGSLGLGLAYIFGMVFPLLLFALFAAHRGERSGGARPRRRVRLGDHEVLWSDAISGFMFVGIGIVTFLVGMSGRESVTPGGLASWDRWITGRFADLAAFLGRAPGWAQAAMLILIAISISLPLWKAARRGRIEPARTDREGGRAADAAVDPVCGMTVAIESAAAILSIGEDRFLFCSEACATSFERDRASTLTTTG
jgi:cytochrome c-type biogenesis protein